MKKEQKALCEVSAETASDDVTPIKKGKAITLVTAAVVLAVIVLNFLVSALSDGGMWYIDTTGKRYKSAASTVYTLSEQCIELVKDEAVAGIDKVNAERAQRGEQPIKLKIVFCADRDSIEADELMRYVSFTARSLEREFSDHIEIEYINILKNPSAVQKYKTTSAATIYDTNVIVEFGSEYLVQNVSAFYYQDTGSSSPWAYNGEQRLCAMMLSLTQAEAPVCAITNNHGELLFDGNGEVKQEYTSFVKLIEGAGYDVVFLDLEKDEIPEHCRMMITFAPTIDFAAYGDGVSEIEKLDKYLDMSNAFFYVCDVNTPKLDNLEEYLEEWGVTVKRVEDAAKTLENYVIKDEANSADAEKGSVVLGNYATEGTGASITKDMRAALYLPKVLFGNATAISPSDSYWKTLTDPDELTGEGACTYYTYYRNGVSRAMFDVFTTYKTAKAEIGGETYEVATERNTFKLMTLTMEERYVQESNYSSINRASYVIALSSTDFVTNEVLDSAAYGNTDVLLATLRNAGGEAVPARVEVKPFYVYGMKDDRAIVASGADVWMACLVAVPVIILSVLGIFVTVRRKYR